MGFSITETVRLSAYQSELRGEPRSGMYQSRCSANDALRHLFATRAIESGVPVPTVARWLGHQDGGALLLKTYSHLLDHHSQESAQKVSF
jgi:integrase